MPVRPPIRLQEIFEGIRDKSKILGYANIIKEYLTDARVKIRDLSKKYGMLHTTVKYFLTERILPLGTNAPFIIPPQNVGLDVYFFKITISDDSIAAIASLKNNDLVRVLWNSEKNVFAIVVGFQGDIEEFRERLKRTYGVKDFSYQKVELQKFDQPIPLSVIDRLVEAMENDLG